MAVQLDTAAEAISIPAGSALNGQAKMGAEFWILWDSFPVGTTTFYSFSLQTAASTNARLTIQWTTAQTCKIGVRAPDSGSQSGLTTPAAVFTAIDRWYHVYCDFDLSAGAPGTARIFIDGELVTSGAMTAGLTNAATDAVNYDNGRIGGRPNSATQGVDGRMEGAKLWRTNLTAGQVKRSYLSRGRILPQLDKLAQWYPMDEGVPLAVCSTTPGLGPIDRPLATAVGPVTYGLGPPTYKRRRAAA